MGKREDDIKDEHYQNRKMPRMKNITNTPTAEVRRRVLRDWEPGTQLRFEDAGWVFTIYRYSRRDVWATKIGTKGMTYKTFCRFSVR